MLSPSASVSDAPLPTADLRSAPAAEPVIRRIWPLATIFFGLSLTAAWMSVLGYLLGYALVTLIQLAF